MAMRVAVISLALVFTFFQSFAIKKTIPDDTTIVVKNWGSITIPAGSQVETDDQGRITGFIPAQNIQVGDITLAANHKVELFADGTIKKFVPLYGFTLRINGTDVEVKPLSAVEMYHNGKIREIHLARDTKFLLPDSSTIVFKAGTYVRFYPNSNIETGLLATIYEYKTDGQSVLLRAGRPVRFYPDGKLESGFLLLPAELESVDGKTVRKTRFAFLKMNRTGKIIE